MSKRKTESVDYLDTSTKRGRISIASLTQDIEEKHEENEKPSNADVGWDEERKDQPRQTNYQYPSLPEEASKVWVLVSKHNAKGWDEPRVAIEGVYADRHAAKMAMRKSCQLRCVKEPYDGPDISFWRRKEGEIDIVAECSWQNEESSKSEIWVEEHLLLDEDAEEL